MYLSTLGTDLQNDETNKQDFHQEYFCFIVKNKNNRPIEREFKFCFSLPVRLNNQRNTNILW